MSYTAENVEKAVLQFYRNGGTQVVGDGWLREAQLSGEAWQFAWPLIAPDRPPEVQFFGANTIATKVARCFKEVPDSDFEGLRGRLVELLRQYIASSKNKIVTTRICVAVASLVINSVPHKWSTPMSDLVNLLRSDVERHGMSALPCFLELLTIIPEEFATIVMASQRRAVVRASLEDSLPVVLQVISSVFQDSNMPSDCVRQAIKCLQSWVQFGIPKEITEEVFDQLMSRLMDEDLFDPSLETMTSIVSQPDMHSHPHTLRRLAHKLLSVEPILEKCLAQEKFEQAMPLASLFIAFGEAHSKLLLDWTMESQEGQMIATRIVKDILNISSCKAQFPIQESISEMAFGFWYIFQDDIIACEPPQYQRCVSVFHSAFISLVDALLQKAMYPINDSGWAADEKESFRCYRTDVADTIMYCHNILRDDLLKLLNDHVDAALTKCTANMDANWPYLEAILYAWSAIGESMAEEEENNHLVQFLAKLNRIPFGNNVKVIGSALDCIGGFAEWLAYYPNLVANLVPLVTQAISVPELSLSATMALKDMARDCSEALKPAAKEILNSCCDALRSDKLKQGECIRLMYPIGKMISMQPADQVMQGLEPILMPYLMELQGITAQPPSPTNKGRILFILKVMTTLFQALALANTKKKQQEAESNQGQQNPDPVAILMPQILPYLKGTADKYLNDEEVMDAIWLLLKQTATSVVEKNPDVILQVIEFISNCYAVKPYSSAIELAHHILVLLSTNPAAEVRNVLILLFARMSTRTVEALQTSANPSEVSDLMATFFQQMSQVVKKHVAFFGVSGIDAKPLVQAAVFCLAVPEVRAVKYAAQFLIQVTSAATENQHMNETMRDLGEMVFRQTMTCIASDKGKNYSEQYADLLFALGKKRFDDLRRYLEMFAKEDGFPTNAVNAQEKTQFAQMLLRERSNKRKVIEMVLEFSLTCVGTK